MAENVLCNGKIFLSSMCNSLPLNVRELQNSSRVTSKLSSPNAPWGYALCFLNLGLDGFTNATQDSITKKYMPFIILSPFYFVHVWMRCCYLQTGAASLGSPNLFYVQMYYEEMV